MIPPVISTSRLPVAAAGRLQALRQARRELTIHSIQRARCRRNADFAPDDATQSVATRQARHSAARDLKLFSQQSEPDLFGPVDSLDGAESATRQFQWDVLTPGQ